MKFSIILLVLCVLAQVLVVDFIEDLKVNSIKQWFSKSDHGCEIFSGGLRVQNYFYKNSKKKKKILFIYVNIAMVV